MNIFPDTRKAWMPQSEPRDSLAMSDPAKTAQHQALVPLFSKHRRLVRFWGRVRERGSSHGSQIRACPADEPFKTHNKSFAKSIYCLHLEAQSPHPAQLSTSPEQPGELGRAALRKSKVGATPALPWTPQLHLCPWEAPVTAKPISHASRAWGCPWNRHN